MRVRAFRVRAQKTRKDELMKRRKRLSRRGSKKLFTATARKVHKANFVKPMRGGERM